MEHYRRDTHQREQNQCIVFFVTGVALEIDTYFNSNNSDATSRMVEVIPVTGECSTKAEWIAVFTGEKEAKRRVLLPRTRRSSGRHNRQSWK